MRRHLLNSKSLILAILIGLISVTLYSASGTPSTLVVRTDANNYLLVTSVTQTNPVTQGVFSSRTLRTDSNGSLQVILTGTVTPTYPMSIPASTCAAPSLGESGAATTGIAFTATPSILECIAGTAVTTITGSSITSTIRYLLPNGTESLPAFSFSSVNNGDNGLFLIANDFPGISSNGTGIIGISGGSVGVQLNSLISLTWSSSTLNSASDTILSRLSANNLLLGPNDIFNIQATALTTTSTDGLILDNTTAALVGTQVQISPRIRLSGRGWDVDDAVSRTVSFFTETLPVAGNTVTGIWKLGFIDPVSSAITYPLQVGSSGYIEQLEQTAPAAGAANTARIYAVDDGAGKTKLCVIFNTGAAQCFATQP
jgi:hypothetical protein